MILNLSGGAPLNFSVTAYASESNMPTSAPENAIAVITTTAISGYVFSSEQPASPVAGMVWFSTGIASPVEFSVTAKNPVSVYPLAAMQYVSGAWKSVMAKTYQNGAWQSWFLYLYDSGDTCDSVTGGYITLAKPRNSSENRTNGAPVITYNSDNMYITLGEIPNLETGGMIHCANKIDLTNYSKMKVKLRNDGIYYQRMVVWSAIGTFQEDNVAAVVALNQNAPGSMIAADAGVTKTVSLDIANLQGSYYVGFGIIAPNAKLYIYDWWLE